MVPKPKPDKVLRHEIVLGRADREMIQQLVTAQSIDKVGETIKELFVVLKDPTEVAGVVVSVAFLMELLGYDVPYFPGPAELKEIIDSMKDARQAREEYQTGTNPFTGSPTTSDPSGITTPAEAYEREGGGTMGFAAALGTAWYNLTNPNWGIGDPDAPGVLEALGDLLD